MVRALATLARDEHAYLSAAADALWPELVCQDGLQFRLDDTGFYARNPAQFAEVSAAFAKAEAALDHAEGEWLRLAILREESAG